MVVGFCLQLGVKMQFSRRQNLFKYFKCMSNAEMHVPMHQRTIHWCAERSKGGLWQLDGASYCLHYPCQSSLVQRGASNVWRSCTNIESSQYHCTVPWEVQNAASYFAGECGRVWNIWRLNTLQQAGHWMFLKYHVSDQSSRVKAHAWNK